MYKFIVFFDKTIYLCEETTKNLNNMKKFLLIFAIAVLGGFSSMKTQAAVSAISDLCGTYSFTAEKVSVADGYDFPTTFDVTIKENVNNPTGVLINGFAGSVEDIQAKVDLTAKTLTIESMPAYSSSNYAVVFSNADGAYPYDNNNGYVTLTISYDDDKNLSLDAYTIVTVDHSNYSATVLGSFKNAKGTFTGGNEVENVNFAGTYKVKATLYDYTQDPTSPTTNANYEYDIVIEAGSDANSYNVTSIAGYNTQYVYATAEGNVLTINLGYNYLLYANPADVLGDASYGSDYSTAGGLTITYADGGYTMSDYSVWAVDYSTTTPTYTRKMFISGNVISEGPEQGETPSNEIEWVGTWKMTIDKSKCHSYDTTYEYPAESTFTIEEGTGYSAGSYIIKTFMNSTDPYGGIAAVPSDDKTTATISNLGYAIISAGMKCTNLADVNGTTAGTITLTNNGDDTLTIGDFCVGYTDYSDNSTGLLVYIPSAAVTIVKAEESAIESVGADVNAPVEYYNLQGVRVANPENGLFIKKQGSRTTKVIL